MSGAPVAVKTAAKLGAGDTVTIEAGEKPIEILFMCSERLGEPIAWYGPIVMNTQQELLIRSTRRPRHVHQESGIIRKRLDGCRGAESARAKRAAVRGARPHWFFAVLNGKERT